MIAADTPLADIMKSAAAQGLLVPAFNVAHLPMLKPMADALVRLKTFALIECARPDVEKFGAQSFDAVYEEYTRSANPAFMRLHLDHAPVVDEEGERVDYKGLIQHAIDLGYDSVMVDGSRLAFEENVAVVKEVCEMAHAAGRPVEAELGAVLGHEKGPLPPYDELFESGQGFTQPEEAERFVKETGVDWLSVAVGNIHGAISGAAKSQDKVAARLNIDHLRKLRDVAGVPMVLHGGSGIQHSYLKEAFQNGIAKLNIGTDIRHAYERPAGEDLSDIAAGVEGVSKRMEEIVEMYEIGRSAEKLA